MTLSNKYMKLKMWRFRLEKTSFIKQWNILCYTPVISFLARKSPSCVMQVFL